jgi:hypothetical protein
MADLGDSRGVAQQSQRIEPALASSRNAVRPPGHVWAIRPGLVLQLAHGTARIRAAAPIAFALQAGQGRLAVLIENRTRRGCRGISPALTRITTGTAYIEEKDAAAHHRSASSARKQDRLRDDTPRASAAAR